MKILCCLCAFLLLTAACDQSEKNDSGKYNESRELVPDPEGYKKDTFIFKDSVK